MKAKHNSLNNLGFTNIFNDLKRNLVIFPIPNSPYACLYLIYLDKVQRSIRVQITLFNKALHERVF